MKYRYCDACGEKKPLTEEYFPLNRKGSHSFKRVCKECANKYEDLLRGAFSEETPRQKMVAKCIRFMKSSRNRFIASISPRETVGLSPSELADHLLWTFVQNYGYEWDGKCAVDIDHITPLHTRECEEDICALCNYENLQLLKTEDHRAKHSLYHL